MGLPDYFSRGALAAAQVLSGFDEGKLAAHLADARIGLRFGPSALGTEGTALTDLCTRLLARFYPALAIDGPDARAAELADLARAINPSVELVAEPTIDIVVGADAGESGAATVIYAGSRGWDAHVGTQVPLEVGGSTNPFGPGAAACLASANVFRAVFLPEAGLDDATALSTLHGQSRALGGPDLGGPEVGDVVLAGVGAIGNAAVWALARAPLRGRMHLVDHETVDASHNLPRYVLATRNDEGRKKVDLGADALGGDLRGVPHDVDLAEFLAQNGHRWDRMLLGLDSARDRRAAQASLPRWVANSWTQPGDLGVSTHPRFGDDGACVCCLYLPEGQVQNEDEIIATALRVPERLMQIRVLLHRGDGAPRDLLDAIATKFELDIEKLLPFLGRPIRSLYVEGLCAGTIVPLDVVGAPRQEVHVPLAHQAALAGVLLAATLARDALSLGSQRTNVVRINLLRPLAPHVSTPALKDPRGICVCQDAAYLDAYRSKYTS